MFLERDVAFINIHPTASLFKSGLKVREAAGVFFVLAGDGKNGFVKAVVAKLLKSHGGCDGRKNGDVCKKRTNIWYFDCVERLSTITDKRLLSNVSE